MFKTLSSCNSVARFGLLLCSFCTALGILFPVFAQEQGAVAPEAVAFIGPVEEAVALADAVFPIQRITDGWNSVSSALQVEDMRAVHSGVTELISLRDSLGYKSMVSYSMTLLEKAQDSFSHGKQDDTSFYLRKAFELSPTEPKLWLSALPMLSLIGESGWRNLAGALFEGVFERPSLLLAGIVGFYYPMLWALTLALYISFLFVFSYQIDDLMRVIAKRFKPGRRGIGTPLLTVLLLVVPCLYGPLWCLAVWSLLIALFLPSRRVLAVASGLVIALWGFSLPTRENLALYLENENIAAALRIAEGDFLRGDLEKLDLLHEQRPEDGFVSFSAALAAKRRGDLKRARTLLTEAERYLGATPYTMAELGTLDMLEGKKKSAAERFDQAAAAGLSSPALLYNRSRLAVMSLDLETAGQYFDVILKEAPIQAKFYQGLEDRSDLPAHLKVAEQRLPLSYLADSGLHPIFGSFSRAQKKAEALMPGMGPFGVGAVGLAVFFITLILRGRRLGSRQSFYVDYSPSDLLVFILRVLPGGSWILSGRTRWSIAVLFLSLLLLMPLANWPQGASWLLDSVPGFSDLYLVFVALVLVTFGYLGSSLERER